MHSGQIIFSQIMDHLPMYEFQKCVHRYHDHHQMKTFSCLDQFLSMAFAQLTYRESLRDIEACLQAQRLKLYYMGIRGKVSKSTLADANEKRDWRIYADFAQVFINITKKSMWHFFNVVKNKEGCFGKTHPVAALAEAGPPLLHHPPTTPSSFLPHQSSEYSPSFLSMN